MRGPAVAFSRIASTSIWSASVCAGTSKDFARSKPRTASRETAGLFCFWDMKLWLVFALSFALPRFAGAEVVASIRYYQREGVSHYRLFVFSDDARSVRPLTSPEHAHDVMPIFAKDGKTITFKRVTR